MPFGLYVKSAQIIQRPVSRGLNNLWSVAAIVPRRCYESLATEKYPFMSINCRNQLSVPCQVSSIWGTHKMFEYHLLWNDRGTQTWLKVWSFVVVFDFASMINPTSNMSIIAAIKRIQAEPSILRQLLGTSRVPPNCEVVKSCCR